MIFANESPRHQSNLIKISLGLLLFFSISCDVVPRTNSEKLHRIFEEYYEDKLLNHPEIATSVGRDDYNDRWTDWSTEARSVRLKDLRRYESRILEIDEQLLSGQDVLSYQLILHEIRDLLLGQQVATYLTSLNQLFGPHTRVYLTVRQMPARSVADYENILRRIEAVGTYVDQSVELYREAIEMGLTQPRLIVELIIRQLDAQLAQG